MSEPCASDHRLRTEVEDVHALLSLTGAHNVFGVSAGAVIALQAALELGEIHKLALYQPSLSFNEVSQTRWGASIRTRTPAQEARVRARHSVEGNR
jgi:pimeloyl-ACP methyl ester carboxylesterase